MVLEPLQALNYSPADDKGTLAPSCSRYRHSPVDPKVEKGL